MMSIGKVEAHSKPLELPCITSDSGIWGIKRNECMILIAYLRHVYYPVLSGYTGICKRGYNRGIDYIPYVSVNDGKLWVKSSSISIPMYCDSFNLIGDRRK